MGTWADEFWGERPYFRTKRKYDKTRARRLAEKWKEGAPEDKVRVVRLKGGYKVYVKQKWPKRKRSRR